MTARTMVHQVADKAMDAAAFLARKGGEGAVTAARKGYAAAHGARAERISDAALTRTEHGVNGLTDSRYAVKTGDLRQKVDHTVGNA